MTLTLSKLVVLGLCLGTVAGADEPRRDGPVEPVPLTRDDMKRALEDSKQATPRLPLPPLTEEEKARIVEQRADAARTGVQPRRFGSANNGRMRSYYLPEYGFGPLGDPDRGRTSRTGLDVDSSFDPSFRTMLFWVVSRGNNCTYCLGHQESSLATRGMTDDQIAALDGDWSEFDPAKRAALVFTTKLSFQPHLIRDEDIDALREHYDEPRIGAIVEAVAGFNATNRWTGPLRIKQDVLNVFVKPTAPRYASLVTRVAPAGRAASARGFVPPKPRGRPPLESRSEVEAALARARTRTPRLKLADESATKALLDGELEGATPPQWMRLLAMRPESGRPRIASYLAVLDKGTLDSRTKAIIAYVAARHDRAWYALGHATKRLKSAKFTNDEILNLDDPEALDSPADRAVVGFAKIVTVDPALVSDDDFIRMRERFGDKKVAEIVYQITQAAFFDRLTEAAGLRLENE